MFWTEALCRPRIMRAVCCGLLYLALMSPWSFTFAMDEPEPSTEVWLVTYGPGEIYWQRFGHNAIWIRDADLGLDHVFNFGFFDFKQENFFLRFLQGRLLYFSAAQPAQREFSSYIDENRSIRAQRLELPPEQSLRLVEYLVDEVQPENRDYLYDYYTNNCSSRVRDALDLALGGALASSFKPIKGEQSWRDHTRRLTVGDFWLYLGLEITLGAKIDQPISRWDEFFIPSELATSLAAMEYTSADGLQLLVTEDVMLYQSSLKPPPREPGTWWPRYLLMSMGLLAIAWLACRLFRKLNPVLLVQGWLLLSGLAGMIIIFLWFFTDHVAAGQNLNLLVFNPLWWVVLYWKQKKAAGPVLLLASVLALSMALLPPHQYTLDVLAAFLPLNIASGISLILFRRRSRRADPPGVPATGDR
jgi:hypothetical protein